MRRQIDENMRLNKHNFTYIREQQTANKFLLDRILKAKPIVNSIRPEISSPKSKPVKPFQIHHLVTDS